MKHTKAKEPSGARKIFRYIKNTLLAAVFAALAVIMVITAFTRFTGGTPSAFGYSIYRVSSGSMSPELQVGDVILVKSVDPMTLKTGDIVTYKGDAGSLEGLTVTHRVTKEAYGQDGEYYIQTKGDANSDPDPPVNITRVVGKLQSKVPALDALYNFFVTPWGLVTIIALIVLAFFNEIVGFVKALTGIGYEQDRESVQDIIERYKKENEDKKDQ